MRNSIWWVGALALLSACGPAGTISGRVTVEGGSPGGHPVIIYGPQSAATVTGDDGTFSFSSLPDGKYVVSASVANADVPDQRVATTVTNGAASPEPVLTFRASTAKVTGRVVMADSSGAENLTVIATGPETRGTRTAADGSFTFDGLKTGAYVVSVEAKDTKEGRVGVGVNASGTAEIIELRLTPVGRVKGVVSYMGNPAAGVQVFVPGTSLSAVTDALGAFALEGIPTGGQTIIARIGNEPFWRSATEMVTITRGANPDLAMTLSDDMPKSGTVTGVVTFGGARSPRDITVTAPGTGVMATPLANGSFSLTLPVGIWDVVANAPLHPAKVLGRVTVTEGSSQALVGQELSWYRPIWRANQTITGLTSLFGGGLQADAVPWTLVTFTEGGEPRLALMHLLTGEFRILAYGSAFAQTRLSRMAKYAGWNINNTLFVYEVATGTIQTYFAPQAISTFEFSTDETTVFIHRANNTLTRQRLAANAMPEIFPPSGTATNVTNSTVDRWFLTEGTNVRLVTVSNDVPNVFTNINVASFTVSPATWSLTNCAATCELRVLAPDSIAPAVRDTAVNPAPGTVSLFAGGNELRADVPCFTYNTGLTTVAFCANATSGAHFPLPAVPTSFRLNDATPLAMSRVIWTSLSGATYSVREESFPPGAATPANATNSAAYTVGWMSSTRAYAIEGAAAMPRVIHLFKTGSPASTESDIGTQAVTRVGPLLVFPKATPGKWAELLGDQATSRPIDIPTTVGVTGAAARVLGTGPLTRYGIVSFDTSTSFVIDDTSVRQLPIGQAVGGIALRSGPTEYALISRSGLLSAFIFNTNATLEVLEFGNGFTIIGTYGLNAWTVLGDDGRTIMLGGFQ